MSVRNILVDNGNTIFCKDINVSGEIVNNSGTVPGLYNVSHNINVYYDGVLVDTISCNFIRLTYGTVPGICFVTIPIFTIPQTTANSFFYLDFSPYSDIHMNTTTIEVIIVNDDGNYKFGFARFNSSNQHLELYPNTGTGQTFNIGVTGSGIPFALTLSYQQA